MRPVVEMLLGVVIPEGRHGRSIDVSRGESGRSRAVCKMPPPSHPVASHRIASPAGGNERERKAVDAMARVPSGLGWTRRELQLQAA